jgi:hypothetical protein
MVFRRGCVAVGLLLVMWVAGAGASAVSAGGAAIAGGQVDYVQDQDVVSPLPEFAMAGGETLQMSVLPDETHGQVFVAGGRLVAVALNGSRRRTEVADISGIDRMVMLPAEPDLVGAEYTTHQLVVVDTRTDTVARHLPLGDTVCPVDLAATAGLVFFSYVDCDTPSDLTRFTSQGVGAVDPSTGRVTLSLLHGFYGSPGASLLAIPGQDALAVAVTFGSSYTAVYGVTGGSSPALTERVRQPDALFGAFESAISPDGHEIVTNGGSGGFYTAYSTTTLQPLGQYDAATSPGTPGGEGVAIRHDGRVMATFYAPYSPDAYFFKQDDWSTRQRVVDYGPPDPSSVVGPPIRLVAGGSPAFGALDAYLVTTDGEDQHPDLRRLRAGPAAGLTITTDRSVYTYGDLVHVAVTLASGTASRAVALYFTPRGGAARLIDRGAVDATTRRLLARLPVSTNGTLEATYVGDDNYAANVATKAVAVAAEVHLSLAHATRSQHWTSIAPHARKTVQAQVIPGNPGTCVSFRLDRLLHGRWKAVRTHTCSRIDRAHRAAWVFHTPARGRLRVAARFAGSASSGGSAWSYLRLRIKR